MDGYRIKPFEDLTIQDDYMFKLVMSYPHICKRMIEKILRVPIEKIVYLEEEKSIQTSYKSKGVRLDVYVADGQNTVYDIEMQVRKPEGKGLFKRTRYYQSMIDADLQKNGQRYDDLNPTYIIFICPFRVFNDGRHKYTFRNRCDEDKDLEMGDEAVKIFLSTKGTMNDVEPDVKNFLNYVDGILSNDDFVQEIDQKIRAVKEDPTEGAMYMTYEMKIKESYDDGMVKGMAKGAQKEREALIIKFLKNGVSIPVIAISTGESKDRIEEIAREHHITLAHE